MRRWASARESLREGPDRLPRGRRVASPAEAQTPTRIGATIAQTGPISTESQGQLRGYRLCVTRLNDKGGVLGRKVELRVYDDGADPATAARLYESSSRRTGWTWCSARTVRA